MLKIKVPATTSNFSVGFDVLGMAVNLYNEFIFEEDENFIMQGFSKGYEQKNLVLDSYISFCKDHGIKDDDIKKIKITLVKQEIPIARGIGSSASCILAGAAAANYFNGLRKSLTEIAGYASDLEGHPDNVFSAVFGNMNTTFKTKTGYENYNFKPSKKLIFAILIPGHLGETEKLRGILPELIPLENAVFHFGRMAHLPKAFESGDMDKLKLIIQDKIHENVRGKYIHKFEEAKDLAKKHGFILSISGSGPSLLLIGEKEKMYPLETLKDTYEVKFVEPSQGMEVKES